MAPTCKQSPIDSQGIQLQTDPCFPGTSSCRKDTALANSHPLPGGCSVFLLLAWSVIKITTACKAELLNVGFSPFHSGGGELWAAQMGFYCRPFGTSARRNIEEYDMGNIQHQEEGWSRSTAAAVFPRANFRESKAIKESCLSPCVLCKHITVCLPQTNLLYGPRGRQGRTLKNETGKANALEPYFRSSSPQQKPAFPSPHSIKVWII